MRWRAALFHTVAAGALVCYGGRPAQAACTGAGAVLTCTGALTGTGVANGGINVGGTFTTLNVNNLDAPITPTANTRGINFVRLNNTNIIINSSAVISATGNAHAMFAYGTGTGSITINHTGDVTSANAIAVYAGRPGAGSVSVTTVGALSGGTYGIFARSNTGGVTVNSTGDIAATNNIGIFAGSVTNTSNAAVQVTSNGDITSGGTSILARTGTYPSAGNGNVTVESTGDLTSGTGAGIYARTGGNGNVLVTSTGVDAGIEAATYGIFARSNNGSVTIDSTGDVAATDFAGLYALAANGAVVIESEGDVSSANGAGIIAFNNGASAGNVRVESLGDVEGATTGILAQSTGGNIEVESEGGITAGIVGIEAYSASGNVVVASDGTITSATGSGIIAGSGSGDVTVESEGTIDVDLTGIYAHSVSGAIEIESTGDVTSAQSAAIWSIGGASSDVTLLTGTVHGATSGVAFDGGGTNVLNNHAALSGGFYAVYGTTGNDTVNNHNLMSGNVFLGDGSNAFFNHVGATFLSGDFVTLNTGTLTNAGFLSPGSIGTIQETVITGDFVQTVDGTFVVDVAGGSADVLTIFGTATFAGTIDPNVISLAGQSGSIMIASATGGLDATLASVLDTGGYGFTLDVLGGNELWLAWQLQMAISILDLLTGPLTPNQEVTAIYLDALQTAGPDAALQALLDAIAGLPNEAEIIAALDRLHGEHYLAQIQDTIHASLFFLNSLMSCPTASGIHAVATEGQCLWARVGGRHFEQDRTNTNIGGDVEAWNVSAGAQVALVGDWRLGFAASYEDVDLTTSNAARSEGERVEAGVVLKNRWGPATLAAGIFGGHAWFDTERTIGLGGIGAAHGEQEISFGGAHARLAVVEQGNGWYIRPMLDLNATYIDYGGFTETGGGAANLVVEGADTWVFSASPAVEIGGDFRAGDAALRPFVRLGLTAFHDMDFSLTSGFLSAPAGVAPFTVTSDANTVFLDVSAGLDVISDGGFQLKLNYDGRFSDDSEMHAGSLKAGVSF